MESKRVNLGRALCVTFVALVNPAAYAQSAHPTELEGVFDKIEVQGVAVSVEFGDQFRAILLDGKASPARLSLRSNQLLITCPSPSAEESCEGNSNNAKVRPIVRVTAPRLSAVKVNRGGKIDIGPRIPAAPEVSLEIHGGGLINAAPIHAVAAAVVIRGGGAVKVSAIERLSANISGGGTVSYFGNPQLRVSTQDGGRVERVGELPSQAANSTFVDLRDGRRYSSVQIGQQTWMSSNLAFLPRVCPAEQAECGFWVYDYSGTDTDAAKKTVAYSRFGTLYSWDQAQTACPGGWRLPTDEDWQQLEVALGMGAAEAASSVWRGTTEGQAAKLGGNSGLDVVLAGWRTSFGKFNFAGEHANFWTASESDPNHGVERLLGASKPQIGRHTGLKGCGFSVRCIRN